MYEDTARHQSGDGLHPNNTPQKQKCRFCPLSFPTIKECIEHIESFHPCKDGDNNYMCSDCGKQYKTKNELITHNNSKCGTIKQFTCKVCGKQLMSAGSLYNHMLRHNGARSFMCRFCAKLFFTAGQLKVHERIHTQDKAYVCEVCNKGFCHRQSLITHSTLHTGVKPFQCENCGNSFSCIGNLIKHRKTHADTCGLVDLRTHRVRHPSTKIKVKINTPKTSRLKVKQKDGEVRNELESLKTELKKETRGERVSTLQMVEGFTNTGELKVLDENLSTNKSAIVSEDEDIDSDSADLVYDEEENDSPKEGKKCEDSEELTKTVSSGVNLCKYCGKKYTNSRWFSKHLEDHETKSSNEAEHKCSCCKKTFATKEESSLHKRTSHADVLTCHDCEKVFSNRDSLRSHQKVFHRGVSRKVYLYVCERCGAQFKQKSHLRCHESRDCGKGPAFECAVCRKRFSSVYTRNTHMRVHDAHKKLLCKFCAKSFHWKGQLKIHERSHTGEKPFACLYCPKAFAYRESLITHSSIHTGIKPHLCEGCGSRFSCIGNLIKHRSTHASECGAWVYKAQVGVA